METGQRIVYDGTFEGLLTAVAVTLDNRLDIQGIGKSEQEQNGLFSTSRIVRTDRRRAMRLWDALGAKSLGLHRIIYFSFLSETADIEMYILNYLRYLFADIEADPVLRKEVRMRLNRWAGKVEAEKSALEAQIRFHTTSKGIPSCRISPEFNVLPLLSRHFRVQFGSCPWMISDQKRGYSLYSRNGQIELVRSGVGSLTTHSGTETGKTPYRPAV